MGHHPDGLFMYGYALGSAESWQIHGGGDALPDWMPDDARYSEYVFKAACEDRLQAAAVTGVEFEQHCYGESPMYALVAKVIRVYEGDAKLVDLPALEQERVAGNWDSRLVHAVETLGITPTQERPGWLVASCYG